MSKGPKPPQPPPIPTPSDSRPPENNPICWQFTPIDQSPVASQLVSDSSLLGSVVNTRVQITSEIGFVGFVPDQEGKEMVDHIRNSKKRLVGHVLSIDADLIVELCAI